MKMKTLICLFVVATLSAATIVVQVKNDAGTVVSTTTITTTNTVLTALNNWRLAQVTQAAIPARAESYGPDSKGPKGEVIKGEVLPAFAGVPAVLKYPTVDAFWKAIIGEFFNTNILPDWHPALVAEKGKLAASNAEIVRLKAEAVK
jgi:hypothetical protein